MAANPSGFQSFADFLDLNDESLRQLEEQAAQRAFQANDNASMALGRAYQQADADVARGGSGQLSGTMAYGDFLKAKGEAERASALPNSMSPQEMAARGFMREENPLSRDFGTQRNDMQNRLNERRTGIDASRRAMEEYKRKQEEEKKKQADDFARAEAAMGPAWRDRQRYTRYSNAVDNSFNNARGRQVRVMAPEEFE